MDFHGLWTSQITHKALGMCVHFSECTVSPFNQIVIRGHDTEGEEPLRYRHSHTQVSHSWPQTEGGIKLLCVVAMHSHYTSSLCVVTICSSCNREVGTQASWDCTVWVPDVEKTSLSTALGKKVGCSWRCYFENPAWRRVLLLFNPLWWPLLHIFHSFIIFIIIHRTHFSFLICLFICKSGPNWALCWVTSHKYVVCSWRTQFSPKDRKLILQMICLELAHSF